MRPMCDTVSLRTLPIPRSGRTKLRRRRHPAVHLGRRLVKESEIDRVEHCSTRSFIPQLLCRNRQADKTSTPCSASGTENERPAPPRFDFESFTDSQDTTSLRRPPRKVVNRSESGHRPKTCLRQH